MHGRDLDPFVRGVPAVPATGPGGDAWTLLGEVQTLPEAGTPVLLAHGAALVAEPRPEEDMDRWRIAAVEVVRCNARLIAFGALAGDGSLPPPLDPSGFRAPELLARVRVIDGRLTQARRRYQRASGSAALVGLSAIVPPVGERVLVKAGDLTRGVGEAESTGGLGIRVRRRVALLDSETSPEDRVKALDLAARALATTSHTAAIVLADRLATTVRSLNAATRGRREQAVLAASYMQVLNAAPPQPVRDWIMRRLVPVLHGRSEFTGHLQDDAERWRAQFEEKAEQDYLVRLVRDHFSRKGVPLRVDEGTAAPAVVLSGADGRVLLTGGQVKGGPPPGGAASRAFMEAFKRLRLLLGWKPVWDPAVFS